MGISPDLPPKQKEFDQKFNLAFPLLSDPDHETATQYGTWAEKKMYGKTYMGIVRSSFLLAEDGRVLSVWYKISPKDTVPEALKALRDAAE